MWLIGVEVEQETSAPPPKKNPGSAPVRVLGYAKIRTVLQSMTVWKFGNVGFRREGRSEYRGKNLFEQGKNQYQTQATYGLASVTQQHKCNAGGLFLAFHLQLTWKKKAQTFASANKANLFVRANCHEPI